MLRRENKSRIAWHFGHWSSLQSRALWITRRMATACYANPIRQHCSRAHSKMTNSCSRMQLRAPVSLAILLAISACQMTPLSNFEKEYGPWESSYDGCDYSLESNGTISIFSGVISLDAEGEIVSQIRPSTSDLRYVAIFPKRFFEPLGKDYASAATHKNRNNIQGVIYRGKIKCRGNSEHDAVIFVRDIGQASKLDQ